MTCKHGETSCVCGQCDAETVQRGLIIKKAENKQAAISLLNSWVSEEPDDEQAESLKKFNAGIDSEQFEQPQ